jgi:hypothetical protein
MFRGATLTPFTYKSSVDSWFLLLNLHVEGTIVHILILNRLLQLYPWRQGSIFLGLRVGQAFMVARSTLVLLNIIVGSTK